MLRFEGKIALVTGGASGIGRACALALAHEGSTVIVADVDEAAGWETCDLVAADGGDATFRRLDVACEADWRVAISNLRETHHGLHILVNNAAICIYAPVLEMSFVSWRRQMSINLDSVFLGAVAAIPLMADSGGGSIVNISSVAGLKGIVGLSGYCASKGGVRLFTKAVALECAQMRNNIRVNSIHPGGIETPIWVKMANDGFMPQVGSNSIAERMKETRLQASESTPLGFAGAPSDIAAGVLYLCSSDARFITGTELVIDGGVFAG